MLRASQFKSFTYGGQRQAGGPVDRKKLLDYIEGYTKWSHGVPPSYAQMMTAMGVTSKASIHRAIIHLVEAGKLRHMPGRARALEVVPRLKPVMDVSDVAWFRVERIDGEATLVEMEGE